MYIPLYCQIFTVVLYIQGPEDDTTDVAHSVECRWCDCVFVCLLVVQHNVMLHYTVVLCEVRKKITLK
jgi:hypothetical protein